MRSSTTGGACTRAWATEPRPRRGPTWRRSSCQRPHEVLISPLHSPGAGPLVERCAGLNVHQASVVCCTLVGPPGCRPRKLLRTFGTTTHELGKLRAWLAEPGVTHVGMESTGIYWKPVYAALEGRFDLTVGNAHHIKNVPGRKTDVKDAEWIARLVRHGLIGKSFVPPPPIRDLRELVRFRRALVEARTAQGSRISVADDEPEHVV